MTKKLSTEEFIAKAKKIHGDIYDYSKVNYVLSNKKIKIYCKKCKKYFEQTPANHLNKSGCPICAKGVLRRTLDSFVKKAKLIHGNKYNYDKVNYKNNVTKVEIYCKRCKKYFEQTPKIHLRGCGCPICGPKDNSYRKKIKKKNSFLEKARKIHGNKYEYDMKTYDCAKKPMFIYCNTCKKWFKQIPSDHLLGHGCKACISKINGEKMRLNMKDIIHRARKIHGDKYSYDKVNYVNAITPVKIYCKKCKKYFDQDIHAHLRGNGCPNCFCSKGEERVMHFLKQNNIEFIYQKRFKDCKDIRTLPFDFYLPLHKICIEFQGEQHYEIVDRSKTKDKLRAKNLFEAIKRHDKIKKEYCKNNNLFLLEIKYDENVEEKLTKLLKK